MKYIYTQKLGRIASFCFIIIFSFVGYAQVGINTTDPKTMLDVNGALSLREGPELNLGKTNVDLNLGSSPYSQYRIVGPLEDFTIDGIVKVPDSDGQLVTLINTTNYTMTLKSNASGNDNKIVCSSNSNLTLTGANSAVSLQYNSALSKWIVIGYSDLGGYGRNVYKSTGTSNINTDLGYFNDMTGMTLTFTPKHAVVYVNFSASGTMDKGANFDSNAYANFQLLKDDNPIVATTTLAAAGLSDNSAFYITKFPFIETFENDSPTLGSWYLREYEIFNRPWELRNGSSGGSANIRTAHSGTQNLYFKGSLVETTKVISPVMDISNLVSPQLTFWHGQPRGGSWPFYFQSELKIYYRSSYSDPWLQLDHYTTNINSWRKMIYTLPNPSATYQISFEGIDYGGHAVVVDEVTISGSGGSGGGILDTAWNAGFTMYPVPVTPGVPTTIKVQWLRDGNTPNTLRNNVASDKDRSHRNITIID